MNLNGKSFLTLLDFTPDLRSPVCSTSPPP